MHPIDVDGDINVDARLNGKKETRDQADLTFAARKGIWFWEVDSSLHTNLKAAEDVPGQQVGKGTCRNTKATKERVFKVNRVL